MKKDESDSKMTPDSTPEESGKPKLHNARRSVRDPFMQIHAQHQQHRIRVGWIIVGAVVFAAVLLGFMAVWGTRQQDGKKQEAWTRIHQRMEACKEAYNVMNGYEKMQTVMKMIGLSEEALYRLSGTVAQQNKWQENIEIYAKLLDHEDNVPKENQPFICPAGLIDMAYIPPGKFYMGRRGLEPGNETELPRHEVEISKGFWMSRREISFGQWWFIGDRAFRVPKWANQTITWYTYPVCMVSWHHAMEYCALLTAAERQKGRIPKDYEYRLPTEAEWEYACRAGTETYYPWNSDTFLPEGTRCANVWDQLAAKRIDDVMRPKYPPADGGIVAWPVGTGAPNAFGLHDMCGNVQEWCFDWFNPNYRALMKNPDPVQNVPVIVDMKTRTLYHEKVIQDATKSVRGGSFAQSPDACRSAARDFLPPSTLNIGIGFRVVLAPAIRVILGTEAQRVTVDTAPVSDLQKRINATDEQRLPDMRTVPKEESLIP